MVERLEKSPSTTEKSAVSAEIRARGWLCELAGPRGWDDSRESWLARGARRAGITYRRARALFYNERIRLSANEYLGIEREYAAAAAALEALQRMASPPDLSAHYHNVQRNGSES